MRNGEKLFEEKVFKRKMWITPHIVFKQGFELEAVHFFLVKTSLEKMSSGTELQPLKLAIDFQKICLACQLAYSFKTNILYLNKHV